MKYVSIYHHINTKCLSSLIDSWMIISHPELQSQNMKLNLWW